MLSDTQRYICTMYCGTNCIGDTYILMSGNDTTTKSDGIS